MTDRPKKVVVLGLDAPIAPRLYHYCKSGQLPTLARFLSDGVWAKNAMVPIPTITPSNWASIATGAWPSSLGVTDFNVHYPGDPLDRTHCCFYSGDVRAEFVWNAIARAGKRSVVINYPTSWPPVMKDGIQIGGAGVEVNQWFWPAGAFGSNTGEPPANVDSEVLFGFAQHGVEAGSAGQAPRCSLSYERIFVTRPFQSQTPQTSFQRAGQGQPDVVALREASGWENMPPANRALETELVVRPSSGLYRMPRPVWYVLVLDTNGAGYDTVLIADSRDAARPMAVLKEGQWSGVIRREFATETGPRRAGFAIKLLELSPDATDLRLYHSAICALDGWSYPESLASEIESEKGLPYPENGFTAFDRGWFGDDTVLEVGEFELNFWMDACGYMLKNKPWDLFMMQYHAPDHAWHSISWLMDPATAASEAEWKHYQEVELAIYQKCDRLAAGIFACTDPAETVYALISDHGAKATNGPSVDLQAILEQGGLLARNGDGAIDWSKTRAVAQRSIYVYVNLKGRDPEGIVAAGEEYRQVQEEVIRLLTDYVEPTTGKKPFLFALRKEDARFINIYGDFVGDVVFAASEHFGGQHGPFLPTAEWGLGSLRGVFALMGTGIKRGVELERNVWCHDLVPTLCYLARWPTPRDAEGAIIYQALERPDLL